ncbi:MAG: aromatic amino acid hydroxylase, partial [Candidatus Zixiibacteriota bacterium]
AYIKSTGPSSLAFGDKELPGHDKNYHKDGFGSPVGRLTNSSKPLEDMTDGDLEKLGIKTGKAGTLKFESGVTVAGHLDKTLRKDGKLILMTFGDCKVTQGSKVLFDPSWGTYDMAVGHRIVSVFNGAADKDAYEQLAMVSRTRTIKINRTEQDKKLYKFYQAIREVRSGNSDHSQLPGVWTKLQKEHPHDWLAPLELLEYLTQNDLYPDIREEIQEFLDKTAQKEKEVTKLINDGLKIVDKEYSARGFARAQKV